MEDIEIDADRFMSIKFKYLGSYFVPELNDTADIMNGSARRESWLHP
jgi:hypothetical protein